MLVTLSSNVNNATCLIRVHTATKNSPEFDKQVHQTRIKGEMTRQTNKPLRHVKENVWQSKHMVDCNDIICTWRICPWRIFRGAQICNDERPFKNSKNVDFDCIMKAFFDERKYFFLHILEKWHFLNLEDVCRTWKWKFEVIIISQFDQSVPLNFKQKYS